MPTEPLTTHELVLRLKEVEQQLAERRENAHALNTQVSGVLGDVQVEVEAHSQALAQLTPAITAMGAQVAEIKVALIGDAFGNRGLVGRFEHGERDRAELRKLVDSHDRKLWATGISLSAVWGMVVLFKEKIFR